jgi:hypothetical protein
MKKTPVIWLSFAIGYLIVFPTLLAVAIPEHSWLTDYRLTQEGHTTIGFITEVRPARHCSFLFKYFVLGTDFVGTDTDCRAEIGTRVAVTYLQEKPAYACVGSPADKLRNEVIAILAGLFVFSSFMTWALKPRPDDLSS